MVHSSNRIGRRPLKSEIRGSNPAWITTYDRLGHRQAVKAPGFELGTAGSNPAVPANDEVPEWPKGVVCKTTIRRFESGPHLHKVPSSSGQGHRPFTPEIAGSNPAGITTYTILYACEFRATTCIKLASNLRLACVKIHFFLSQNKTHLRKYAYFAILTK